MPLVREVWEFRRSQDTAETALKIMATALTSRLLRVGNDP
jgi:hypothetical protein